MAADERLLKILDALLERTKRDEVDWSESSRQERFVYSTHSGSVAIQTRDGDSTAPYELVVYNNNGQAVETLSSAAEMSLTGRLRDLYSLAFRAAVRVDRTLDGILSEVQESGAAPREIVDDLPL